MRKTKDFVFFWNGPFSQWHKSQFIAGREERKFVCCEQWMMWKKAKLFGDDATAYDIMKTEDPKEQKSLGRKVKNFQPEIWDQNKFEIVCEGNLLKFAQNKNLRKILMNTGDKILVEASPYDKIWGIGMREDDEGVEDPKNWKGENLLGAALTTLRDLFFKNYPEEGLPYLR